METDRNFSQSFRACYEMDERHIGRDFMVVYHCFIAVAANIAGADHSRAREGVFIPQHFDLMLNLAMSCQRGTPRRANSGRARS